MSHQEQSSPGASLVAVVATVAGLLFWQPARAQVSQFGLDTRPANPTCIAPPRPTNGGTVTDVEAFPTAPNFTQPLKMRQVPGDATRWYVAEKTGRIKVFNTSNPASVSTYLDLTSKVDSQYTESGLLGFAFHPNFPATPEIFVAYSAPSAIAVLETRVSRIILDSTVTPVNTTEQILLRLNKADDTHNGGNIEFGPDGYLYIGFGDGGVAGDPDNNAQDTKNLLGDMLRINVVGVAFPTPGYGIPADNPFAGNAKCGPTGSNPQNCPEIYAWGFRNPWRWSIDPQTQTLWVGDVGDTAWEEVDIVQRGGNYGWHCREGLHASGFGSNCPAGLSDPVLEYSHGEGLAVTGGYVYRGTLFPQLYGRYVFGDYGFGSIWALTDNGAGGYTKEELVISGDSISSFGVGNDNELYYLAIQSGRIRRLTQVTGGGTNTIPTNLTATGCVNPAAPAQPSAGLVPYDLNAAFWSDGATKSRYMGLPDNTTISINAANDWNFPNGTVLRKDFRLAGQLVETRLFMRHPDGVWAGYTYEWNGAQTEATRVIGGKTKLINGQQWIYPSEVQCLRCHTAAAGYALGPETGQLNRNFLYPSTGRTANQLATLDHIGMFSVALPGAPDTLPRIANPSDSAEMPHARARAYLHTNCSQCHRPGGPTPVNMDFRYTTALQSMNACNVNPSAGNLGIAGAKLIAPGQDALSVLTARDRLRDSNGMPPLASNIVDTQGIAVVSAWINSLGSCQDTDNDQVDDVRDNCPSVVNTNQADTDGDARGNACDNCRLVANNTGASAQCDSDNDGYGNGCDADFGKPAPGNGVTNVQDYIIFRGKLAQPSSPPTYNVGDINCNGSVNSQDYTLFRSLLALPPGPGAGP